MLNQSKTTNRAKALALLDEFAERLEGYFLRKQDDNDGYDANVAARRAADVRDKILDMIHD